MFRMSVDSSEVPLFQPGTGNPPIPWAEWKLNWSAFLQKRQFHIARLSVPTDANSVPGTAAQQASTYTDAEKNAELVLRLGAEGRRLFNGTDAGISIAEDFASKTHKDVLAACDVLFHATVS